MLFFFDLIDLLLFKNPLDILQIFRLSLLHYTPAKNVGWQVHRIAAVAVKFTFE